MASESSRSSGSAGEDWVPSAEQLENRELLSGLLDGLSDLAATARAEEAAAVPDPGVDEPPAVVVPPAEASPSDVVGHASAHLGSSLAPNGATEAPEPSPAVPGVSGLAEVDGSSMGASGVGEGAHAPSPAAPIASAVAGAAVNVSTPRSAADSSQATAVTAATPAAAEHATAPGAEAIDALLGKVAVDRDAHASSPAVNSARTSGVESGSVVQSPAAQHSAGPKAAEALAAQNSGARISTEGPSADVTGSAPTARDVQAPHARSVSAHDAGMVEGRADHGASPECEFDCLPTGEGAAHPQMMDGVSPGEHARGPVEVENVGLELHSHEENQHEEAKAPIERSLLSSTGRHTAADPSWVRAEQATTQAPHSGEIKIVEQHQTQEDLVSRVSQLFDLVPNWPGVDLDAVEDAARSVAHDGAQRGVELVMRVSTQDASCWVTAMAGTVIGSGIAQHELGLQTRDTAEAPTSEEVERGWSAT
jgi:hypothetical protein